MRYRAAILAFLLACSIQPFVARDPVVHVLVQIPLLAASGYLLPVKARLSASATGPLLVLALTTAIIWMLPRSVDAAIAEPGWTLAKFVSLPLMLGLPLGMAWARVSPMLRGFAKAQTISMLLFLAFLYSHSPLRICNAYLIDDQVRLGWGFAIAACLLAVCWLLPAFIGRVPDAAKCRVDDLSVLGH